MMLAQQNKDSLEDALVPGKIVQLETQDQLLKTPNGLFAQEFDYQECGHHNSRDYSKFLKYDEKSSIVSNSIDNESTNVLHTVDHTLVLQEQSSRNLTDSCQVDNGTSDVTSPPASSNLSTARSVSPPPRFVPDPVRRKGESRKRTKFIDDFQNEMLNTMIAQPKGSIPANMTPEEYAHECVDAAVQSRLPPYFLHPLEHSLFKDYLNHLQITTYLNIRNGILRLWQKNLSLPVSIEEALGTIQDENHMRLARKCHEFLVRYGFINFGCIEFPEIIRHGVTSLERPKKIVIIGAGIAGIGCCRQLEGLFRQLQDHYPNEAPPEILIVEARDRIGGRMYSKPVQTKLTDASSKKVDLGAQIVTGFDDGNPMNAIIRRQLKLPVYSLTDNSVLYDIDGKPLNSAIDMRVERLANCILDRASTFKEKATSPRHIEGDRILIDAAREPIGKGGRTIGEIEANEAIIPPLATLPCHASSANAQKSRSSDISTSLLTSLDKITGKVRPSMGSNTLQPAAATLVKAGFSINPGNCMPTRSLIKPLPDNGFPTLGDTIKGITKYFQKLVDISPVDLRALNWHWANLEYANAVNLDDLSLPHWDQDDGNEFQGAHAMVIGGYDRVPQCMAEFPRKLNIKYNFIVKEITYPPENGTWANSSIIVKSAEDEIIEADAVIITLPIGVLKQNDIIFEPPLPDWKLESIQRMGFGVLNKKPFWDLTKDLIGCLRPAQGDPCLTDSYDLDRGRFYLIWNCVPVCQQPVLVALIAGHAARRSEYQSDQDLKDSLMTTLSRIYNDKLPLPQPIDVTVTRWHMDPFSRGTYTYVGCVATGDDYDILAKPVGSRLFFAGEGTCRTHPATVHGAYISGLRVAAEIFDELYGKISLPDLEKGERLIYQSEVNSRKSTRYFVRNEVNCEAPKSRRGSDSGLSIEESTAKSRRLETLILQQAGPRPIPPRKPGINPFAVFMKEEWENCSAQANLEKRLRTGDPNAATTVDERREVCGRMWKNLSDHDKGIWQAKVAERQRNYKLLDCEYKAAYKLWRAKTQSIRARYDGL